MVWGLRIFLQKLFESIVYSLILNLASQTFQALTQPAESGWTPENTSLFSSVNQIGSVSNPSAVYFMHMVQKEQKVFKHKAFITKKMIFSLLLITFISGMESLFNFLTYLKVLSMDFQNQIAASIATFSSFRSFQNCC
jgi:hypothetical protein